MSKYDGYEIIHPKFSLDVSKSELLRSLIDDAIKKGKEGIILDCENVEMIDSAGLGILVQGMKKLKENSRRFIVVNMNPHVEDIFRITRLYKHFEIYNTLDEAMNQLGSL